MKNKKNISWILGIVTIAFFLGALYFFLAPKPLSHMKMADVANNYQIDKISIKEIEKNKKKRNNISLDAEEVGTKAADKEEVSSFPSDDNKEIPTATNTGITFDWDSVRPISPDTISQAKSDDLPVVGGIAIPELGVNLPIFKGVSNSNLTYGAGTMNENQEMGEGNYGLASHHVFSMAGASELLFSPLDRASKGQNIYLTDKGKVYVYEIDNIEEVTPYGSHVMDAPKRGEKPKVTLVTCTDIYGENRRIVQGSLVEVFDWSGASKQIKDYFKKSYNAFQL